MEKLIIFMMLLCVLIPGRQAWGDDEVRIYSRALLEAEVKTHFQAGLRKLSLMADYRLAQASQTVRLGDVALEATEQGQIQLDTGQEVYLLESAFSYPGETIGWNLLKGSEKGSESLWSPKVRKVSQTALEIEAKGRFYNLRRRVSLKKGKIEFEDRVRNLQRESVSLIVRHDLIAPEPFESAFTPGVGENPTIFLAGPKDSLGVLVEDNIFRLRFEPALGVPANRARFRMSGLTLDKGKSYTMRWSLYLLDRDADYFAFINRVRQDWKTSFTIEGPFAFFDISSPLLNDPDRLKAYLSRKSLKVAALMPWLDYDPGSFDRVWSRQEYKERMRKAIRALKAVDPSIKCIGCIETDWVTLYPEKIRGGEKLPQASPGGGGGATLTAEQTRLLDEADLPWKDSVKRKGGGNLTLELYMRGGKPQTALSVYPAVGNYQYEFLMGQVQFILDEVGMDSFYIDEFSQGWNGSSQRDYSRWDGWSAEINPRTGKIGRRYTDCSLVGILARVNLCNYALKRGKIVVANTYSTSREEQNLPVNRFAETQASFDPFAVPDGAEPPAVSDLYNGSLASPIGLGIVSSGKPDIARRIMKAVITYLGHGVLYYHYAIEDIPETGDGSGEYGPINHMFPITPVKISKGRIEGKERTITCVSGDYSWPHSKKPSVRLFGLNGREKPSQATIHRAGRGWESELR